MIMMSLLHSAIAWCLLCLSVHATPYLNTTVDDANPSIVYLPATGAWTRDGFCAEGVCWATPDPSQLYGETWHETTRYENSPPFNITLPFNGVAIYVYGVFWDAPTIARIDLEFTVDNGYRSGSFLRENRPISKYAFTYNQVVFSADKLFDGEHTLVIKMNPYSWFMFDRVVVTKTTPYPSSSPTRDDGDGGPRPTAPTRNGPSGSTLIASGMLGGALGGIIAGAIIAYVLMQQRRADRRIQLPPDEPENPLLSQPQQSQTSPIPSEHRSS
ncbi:hypothetical protein FRC02_001682 [Tulasnella sp. 418]|nr:hypothetical protein FRC02_001682 [Tulasnella sp. 418]